MGKEQESSLEQNVYPGGGCREEDWWKGRGAVGSTLEAPEGFKAV